MDKYEFVVIGSGPAAQRAAIQAAKLGRSVLLIEKYTRVGGACVHTGTIPSKTLREAVLYLMGIIYFVAQICDIIFLNLG